jgi:hypothetical protein
MMKMNPFKSPRSKHSVLAAQFLLSVVALVNASKPEAHSRDPYPPRRHVPLIWFKTTMCGATPISAVPVFPGIELHLGVKSSLAT